MGAAAIKWKMKLGASEPVIPRAAPSTAPPSVKGPSAKPSSTASPRPPTLSPQPPRGDHSVADAPRGSPSAAPSPVSREDRKERRKSLLGSAKDKIKQLGKKVWLIPSFRDHLRGIVAFQKTFFFFVLFPRVFSPVCFSFRRSKRPLCV